jgi:phosphonate transport system substrate-binding protein
VLAIELREHPESATDLKIIDSLGPSTIQPVVVAVHLSQEVRAEVRRALLEMHEDPQAQVALAYGFVERFVPVADGAYDDIRRMLAAAEHAGFMQLR